MSNIAPIVPFIPAIVSGIGLVGGLVTGKQQADQNQQLINSQNQTLAQQRQYASQLASSVNKQDYQQQASMDVKSSLQDVFSAMASRGLGRSTAALTAASQTSGQIRSQYGKQYLADRLSAISGAAGILGQNASTPRMGYDSQPFAAANAGLKGISDWGAKWASTQQPAPIVPPSNTQPVYQYSPNYISPPVSQPYYG